MTGARAWLRSLRGRPAAPTTPLARRTPPRESAAQQASRARSPVADLQAVAAHADQRAALYRRKVLLGRGEPRRLAELERISAGAASRVKAAIRSHGSAVTPAPAEPANLTRGKEDRHE